MTWVTLLSTIVFEEYSSPGKRNICRWENRDFTLFSRSSTTSNRQVIPVSVKHYAVFSEKLIKKCICYLPMIQIGVWADCDISNKLYNSVWLWWLQNKSNFSIIKITALEVFLSPVFKQAKRNARFSAKLPKTFPSTAFSNFICDVALFKARRSSVCIKPWSSTKTAFELNVLTPRSLFKTLLISYK